MTDTINHYLCMTLNPACMGDLVDGSLRLPWRYCAQRYSQDNMVIWRDRAGETYYRSTHGNESESRDVWYTSACTWQQIRSNPKTYLSDENGNPLPAMPAESAKHHEPVQESVAPIYWRCNWETVSQQNGFADYRCLDGVTVEINDGSSWYKTHLSTVSFLETSRDHARCNADGTPIVESGERIKEREADNPVASEPAWVAQTEEIADAPLKVGDWVETQNLELAEHYVRQSLVRLTWPRKITRINAVNLTVEGLDSYVAQLFFRRVPPPSEQVEIAAEHDRIAELTKERDEAREQLATVQAEAAAMRESVHEVVKEFRKLEAMEGNEPIRCSRIHFGEWADRLLEPTAGRELLDELRRKDERIAELKTFWKRSFKEEARQRSKCRTAKRELIEARAKLDSRRWGRVAAELSLRLDGCDLSAVGHSDVSIGMHDTSDEKGGAI